MSDADLFRELQTLVSEERHPLSRDLDRLSAAEIVALMNSEDRLVPLGVEKVLPEIARAVERIADAFRRGGRLIYQGAGTSGRLGVLDASECPPTFGVPDGMVIGLLAGGRRALTDAVEGAEDDAPAGAADLEAVGLAPADVVVAIAASGRTPYALGGLAHAKATGCTTIAITCNPGSALHVMAEIAISPRVGPEVLTGSTRLKSGTAQKLVLNMLSTASMIRIGKSYGNLMVDVSAANAKLVARACRIVVEATGCEPAEARRLLERTGFEAKPAILMALTGIDEREARRRLANASGFLRTALDEVRG